MDCKAKKNRTRMRVAYGVVMVLFLIIMTSCKSATPTPRGETVFAVVNTQDMLNPGSILILSGNYDKYDYELSLLCIQQFLHKTAFKPVIIDRIKKVIKDYPVDIIDFNIPASLINTPSISETSKKMIDDIQKKFGTRYVLVLWHSNHYFSSAPGFAGMNMYLTNHSMVIRTRLLRYPGGEIVGFSDFVHTGTTANVQNQEDALREYLAGAVDKLVDEFNAKTKPR